MAKQLKGTLGTYQPDNLFAGSVMPRVTGGVKIKIGQVLSRGTVLGIITETQEAVAVDSTSTDGSEQPYGILVDDVDATEKSKGAVVYLAGNFNKDALIFGGTDTADTHEEKLRDIGIHL